jgi:maltose/moltooligosaccharide transporter
MENTNGYERFTPLMPPNSTEKMNVRRVCALSLSFFTVLLAWSYFNLKVPLLLESIIPDTPSRDAIIGAIMAIDNIIAVIVQPFFGDLSDRTQSVLGRRMPWIICGGSLSAFFFIMIPLFKVLAGVIIIIFLFDLFMATFRGASVSIVPDYTPDKFRSAASSTQQFIANIGGLIGFFMPKIIEMLKITDQYVEESIGFWIVAILMVVAVLGMSIAIKETPTGTKLFTIGKEKFDLDSITFEIRKKEVDESANALSSYVEIGKIFKENKSFGFMLITVFFFYLGFSGIEAFFSRFAINYFGVSEGTAGLMMIAYSGPMILSAPLHGLLGQKVGRKKALLICCIWVIIAMSIFSFAIVPLMYRNANVPVIMGFLALISIPWMGVIVQSFPVMWALSPEEKIGGYMGIYYTFNQTGYSISPIVLGAILSAFSFMGDHRFEIMFPYVLVCIVLGLLFFLKVKGGEEKLCEEKIKELTDKYCKED